MIKTNKRIMQIIFIILFTMIITVVSADKVTQASNNYESYDGIVSNPGPLGETVYCLCHGWDHLSGNYVPISSGELSESEAYMFLNRRIYFIKTLCLENLWI